MKKGSISTKTILNFLKKTKTNTGESENHNRQSSPKRLCSAPLSNNPTANLNKVS
jgi:hypothetical protein